MKTYIARMSTLAISILLAGGLAADGFAGAANKSKNREGAMTFAAPQVKNAVSVSGVYTGSLQGRIRLNDRYVVITKDTRIFRTGDGIIEYGSIVTKSPIHVSAVVKDGKAYAKSVIVSAPTRDDGHGKAGELDSKSPN